MASGMKLLWASVLLLLGSRLAQALDVELESITCDESLQVTADLYMQCAEGGARCTFGNSTTLTGTIYYNGVDNSGVENNVAYMSAELMLWTLDFSLLDMMEVPLCDESMVADENNANDCPGDGAHDFSISYKLPSAGSDPASWLASGWEGSGIVRMYAEPSEDMMIGECTLALRTYVTQKNKDSLVGTPSAAATAGIVIGVAALLALLAFYCYCCRSKRKAKKAKINAVEDEEAYFKRMEDERSYWSGAGSRASKKTSATKKTNASASVVSELDT